MMFEIEKETRFTLEQRLLYNIWQELQEIKKNTSMELIAKKDKMTLNQDSNQDSNQELKEFLKENSQFNGDASNLKEIEKAKNKSGAKSNNKEG